MVSTGILVGVAEIMALAALSFAVTLHWAFFFGWKKSSTSTCLCYDAVGECALVCEDVEFAGCLGRIYSPIASNNRPPKK